MSSSSENSADQNYDVAISFLSRDSDFAVDLSNRLGPLNVFCFPRNQEELAGTDGMESSSGSATVQIRFRGKSARRSSSSAGVTRWGDRVGTIETGLYGDIVAVKGDPLSDISELENIDVVIKGGLIFKMP